MCASSIYAPVTNCLEKVGGMTKHDIDIDTGTISKRRHSGTFIVNNSTGTPCLTIADREKVTVRKLVEHWEAREKESGTSMHRGVFSFGENHDQMVGSPLKRRRIVQLSPDDHLGTPPGPPPTAWTRPRTRSSCPALPMSPRTQRRRPPTKLCKPGRAPPSSTSENEENSLFLTHSISRWPSWGSTSVGTGTGHCSYSSGSGLDIQHLSKQQTTPDNGGGHATAFVSDMTVSVPQRPVMDGHGHAVPHEGDPGGHHHRQPAQDGSTTQLFGFSTMLHHHQETSIKEKVRLINKMENKENKEAQNIISEEETKPKKEEEKKNTVIIKEERRNKVENIIEEKERKKERKKGRSSQLFFIMNTVDQA